MSCRKSRGPEIFSSLFLLRSQLADPSLWSLKPPCRFGALPSLTYCCLCGDLQDETAAVDPSSADGAITEDGWEVFHFEGGLQEYVQWLNRERDALHAPITVQRQVSAGRRAPML